MKVLSKIYVPVDVRSIKSWSIDDLLSRLELCERMEKLLLTAQDRYDWRTAEYAEETHKLDDFAREAVVVRHELRERFTNLTGGRDLRDVAERLGW